MEIDLNALFGGQMSWKAIGASRGDVERETGVDGGTLSRIKAGREGFGAEAAKRVAPLAGVNAADLFVASQVRAAKKRRESGEIDDATTMRVLGKVLAGLKSEYAGGKIANENAKALRDLAAEASKNGARPTGKSTYEVLGRDTTGCKIAAKSRGRERDALGLPKKMRYGS